MKGSYILVLNLNQDACLTIGRLGTFEFPAGLYLYCGSALNGLEGRIRRHLRRDKKLHWHIDYLAAAADVVEVWWAAGDERLECRWSEAIIGQGGEVVARWFGSSDCRCPTHLLKAGDGRNLAEMRGLLLGSLKNEGTGHWVIDRNENPRSFELQGSI